MIHIENEVVRGPADVNEVVIVRSTGLTVDDLAYREFVEGIRTEIDGLGEKSIASVTSYFKTGDASLVSDDRMTTILPLVMAGKFIDAESNVEDVIAIVDRTNEADGFEVFITGESTFSNDFAEGNQADAEKGEAFGIPIAMVILAVVFGAIAAALLPMALALTSIIITFGVILLIGQVIQLQVFVQNLVTMIGLAVGID